MLKNKKIFKFIAVLTLIGCYLFNIIGNCYAYNDAREKSKVLILINNIANTKHDKALNEIMYKELHKKIDGIYFEEDNQKYLKSIEGKDNSQLTVTEMLEKINDSDSDYLIYAELKRIDKKSDFNFVYYDKEVTATFCLRIIDIKNKKELYSSEYSMTAEDSTDYFFIGSASVAKKAIKKVMFKAGEAISVYLPL